MLDQINDKDNIKIIIPRSPSKNYKKVVALIEDLPNEFHWVETNGVYVLHFQSKALKENHKAIKRIVFLAGNWKTFKAYINKQAYFAFNSFPHSLLMFKYHLQTRTLNAQYNVRSDFISEPYDKEKCDQLLTTLDDNFEMKFVFQNPSFDYPRSEEDIDDLIGEEIKALSALPNYKKELFFDEVTHSVEIDKAYFQENIKQMFTLNWTQLVSSDKGYCAADNENLGRHEITTIKECFGDFLKTSPDPVHYCKATKYEFEEDRKDNNKKSDCWDKFYKDDSKSSGIYKNCGYGCPYLQVDKFKNLNEYCFEIVKAAKYYTLCPNFDTSILKNKFKVITQQKSKVPSATTKKKKVNK